MNYKDYLQYFGAAWDMLIDLPLPKKVVDFRNDEVRDLNIQRFFPIVGLVTGLLAFFLAKLLLGLLNHTTACIIFVLVMTIVSVVKDSGRSLACLVSFIELKTENVSTVTALYNMKGQINIRKAQSLVSMLTIVMILLFYMLFFLLMLIYKFPFLMILIWTLSFTIQGALATLPSTSDRRPIISVPDHGVFQIWIIAGVICLFVMFADITASIYATLVIALIAFFGTQMIRRFCEKKVGGISTNIIGFIGFAFEIIAMLIGIMFLVK